MPGILPMKVIKVGSSSQSRIAQACDRCRSKKIRCDGIRPCCSQCANVGFECKTSDKLSRRAFPRGYTESLEERVRSLEESVRELKDLLDEKDEKIDMLSKMHSNRRGSISSTATASPGDGKRDLISPLPKEDVFRVQASSLLLEIENSDAYFMGASSGRAFVDALKRKIQESGKSLTGLNTDTFLNVVQSGTASPPPELSSKPSTAPPRMFSDRYVNVFFQEWAPLFPVLHKPAFLRLYEEYMSSPEDMTDPHKLAQLHLVFAIASLSSDMPDQELTASCGVQWRVSLDVVLMENSLLTLQCLILALIYCISKADYGRLQHYKGIAVGLSHRLGLHQSQKRFSFGALTTETRKKVFWTLYTVDCFSAALLGLPKLLKEADIHAEYPSDTDDEYVTEKGFQPTLPGEYTKISSALALIRASRILSKVLDHNYPAAATHDLSLQSLTALENELNEWSDKLPTHLKLTFVQDKPSTEVTGSRSALLSLAFYYIRTLIHRPAVGSSLGTKSSPSVLSLADSSKHIIQIVQLLDERNMSFSFCLNKNEMLTLCGLGILYQGLDLKQEGKLMQDGLRMVAVVIKYLEKGNAPGATDFKRLAASMLKTDTLFTDMHAIHTVTSAKSIPSSSMLRKQLSPPLYRHASASISERDLLSQQEKLRRATLPNLMLSPDINVYGRNSIDSARSELSMARREHRSSASQLPTITKAHSFNHSKAPNLDYLSLTNTPEQSKPASPAQSRHHQPTPNPANHDHHLPTSAYRDSKIPAAPPSDWEVLLGSFDDRHLYDAIYGGGPNVLEAGTTTYATWSPEPWDLTLGTGDVNGAAAPAQSVLSFSEESLSSGDDIAASDPNGLHHDYKMPGTVSAADGYGFLLDGFDTALGL